MNPFNRSIRHIIWDFNGTLFDDLGLCVELLGRTCREHSLEPINRERYRELFCHPVIDFYRKAGLDGNYEAWAYDFHVQYQLNVGKCTLHNGARDILLFFRNQGITQSILSALPHKILMSIIEDHSLRTFFIDITGARDPLAHGKVDAAREWIVQHDYRPAEILLIGDTNHDAEVAKALKLNCVLVAHGFQTRDRLEECGIPVFDSLAELKDGLELSNFTDR